MIVMHNCFLCPLEFPAVSLGSWKSVFKWVGLWARIDENVKPKVFRLGREAKETTTCSVSEDRTSSFKSGAFGGV